MEQVGRYRVTQQLGRGPRGAVYKAQDQQTGRVIMIKTIRFPDIPDIGQRERARAALLSGVQSAEALSHPNIATLYGVVEQEGIGCMLIEYSPASSLAADLQSGAIADADTLLHFLRQVSEALDYAHRKGVAHGNLKPENILISEGGPALDRHSELTDYGLADLVAEDLRVPGRPPALASYLSPEQIRGKVADGFSDQFSLAVIIYEILTGRKPFGGETLRALGDAICKAVPQSIQEMEPTLDATVNRVLQTALSKDPSRRYPTCSAFVGTLTIALGDCPDWVPAIANRKPAPVSAMAAAAGAVTRPAAAGAVTKPAVAGAVTMPAAAGAVTMPAVAGAVTMPAAAGAVTKPAVAGAVTKPAVAGAVTMPAAAAAVTMPAAAEISVPPHGPPANVAEDLRSAEPFEAVGEKTALPQTPEPVSTPDAPESGQPAFNFASVYEHIDERDSRRKGSRANKAAVGLLAGVALLSAAVYFSGWRPEPDMPTQVLDTNAGPVTAPPAQDRVVTSGKPKTTKKLESAANDVQRVPTIERSHDIQPAQKLSPPRVDTPLAQTRTSSSRPPIPIQPPPSQPPPTRISDVVPQGQRVTSLDLLSEPPGGRVTVDGNPASACVAPCSLSLSNGRHTADIELNGYAVAHRIFNVPENNNLFVTLTPSMGVLMLTSTPSGSQVNIDGKPSGQTPATLRLPSGPHRITMTYGGMRHEETVEVESDGFQARSFNWQSAKF